MKQNIQQDIADTKDEIKEYINHSIDLSKLHLAEGLSRFFSDILTKMIILYLAFFVLLFISLAGAYFLGELWNNIKLGFLVIAGVYLIFLIWFLLTKHHYIEKPIIKSFIQLFFPNFSDYDEKE